MPADARWLAEQADGRHVGILLAAGAGTRFDLAGIRNKLQQPFSEGRPVAVVAADNLRSAIPEVLAVVRPGADLLAQQLAEAGCAVTNCEAAASGMAASLVHAIRATRAARGWLIALGDMPRVQPRTMRTLLAALQAGASIAVPVCGERRGNPVAFGAVHLSELLSLQGDQGARSLLLRHPVTEIEVDDPGIAFDIDTAEDMGR